MSETRNNAALLQRIHRYHRQLNELAARQTKAKRRILFARQEEAEAAARRDEAKKAQQELIVARKDKENQVAIGEKELAKRRTQLSEAKNNKEYQSLQDQIAVNKANNDALADEAFELMEQAEAYDGTIEKIDGEIVEAQKKIAAAEAQFREENPVLEQDIAHFKAELARAAEELPRAYRPLYDRAVQSYGGELGLAPIVDQSFCGYCRQQIPIRYIAQMCEDQPHICESCGRLVYLPEGYILK